MTTTPDAEKRAFRCVNCKRINDAISMPDQCGYCWCKELVDCGPQWRGTPYEDSVDLSTSNAGMTQPFQRGQRVRKIKGLPFGDGDAVVLCCYPLLETFSFLDPADLREYLPGKDYRVVVQHPEGWQHIFSPDQLEIVP